MASGKDEIVGEVKRFLGDRESLRAGDRDALLADLRELADKHALAYDVDVCDELFATQADAFCLGMLAGEAFPSEAPPDAITGAGKPVLMTPPLPAVEQRPGPHADDWRKPLES